MNSVALHKFVAIDCILLNHVHEMTKMCIAISKGWTGMHNPVFVISLPAIELIIVQLMGHEGKDVGLFDWIRLPLRELCAHLEKTKRV